MNNIFAPNVNLLDALTDHDKQTLLNLNGSERIADLSPSLKTLFVSLNDKINKDKETATQTKFVIANKTEESGQDEATAMLTYLDEVLGVLLDFEERIAELTKETVETERKALAVSQAARSLNKLLAKENLTYGDMSLGGVESLVHSELCAAVESFERRAERIRQTTREAEQTTNLFENNKVSNECLFAATAEVVEVLKQSAESVLAKVETMRPGKLSELFLQPLGDSLFKHFANIKRFLLKEKLDN